jgi:isopentenyldiphosphate isomerase
MENFDILDCRGMKTGETILRDEAHRIGAWHGAFHCLIIYKREGRGHALFQKRSAQKKIAPNRFDVSVGGHYSAGENATIAGPREINEELGLDVKFDQLLPVGRRVFVYCFDAGVKEYEFQDVFLLPRDVRQHEVTLQEEEVAGLLEMEVESGIKLFSREIPAIECRRLRTGSRDEFINVSADEFVPCLDNYYLKLLLLVQRYFGGERKRLAI